MNPDKLAPLARYTHRIAPSPLVVPGHLVALNHGKLRPFDTSQLQRFVTAARLTKTFVPTARPPVA